MKYKPQVAAQTTASAGKPRHLKPAQKHQVRIIGGVWKRTQLPVADQPGLRPTPDRVRQTLFNWLGQDLRGWRCVDVFAGTGVLGFEAASRGAKEVVVIEQDAAQVLQLRKIQLKLNATAVRVLRGDGVTALRERSAESADLVLLDPPFDADLFETALLAAARVVSASGQVYLEAPRQWKDADLQTFGLYVHRHLKAGAVHAHLLRCCADNRQMSSATTMNG